uniref:Uncharacterized protein n=1 Tax=Heterorhabditis bacteriophora TaxID=37862 RepID=A0A1I7WSB9_HETBA
MYVYTYIYIISLSIYPRSSEGEGYFLYKTVNTTWRVIYILNINSKILSNIINHWILTQTSLLCFCIGPSFRTNKGTTMINYLLI